MELKREILRFCDPSTLAKTSRVSLAFLEMSSPLLYTDISIDTIPKLASLFRQRDDLAQPQLEPYLSLSQIKHLTYTSPNQDLFPHPSYLADFIHSRASLRQLSKDRVPPSTSSSPFSPHAVELSSLLVRTYATFGESDTILPLFNPTHCIIQGTAPIQRRRPLRSCFVNYALRNWDRLSTLVAKDADLYHYHVPDARLLHPRFEVAHDLTSGCEEPQVNVVAKALVGRRMVSPERGEGRKVKVPVGDDLGKERFLEMMVERVEYVVDVNDDERPSNDQLEAMKEDVLVEVRAASRE